MIEKTLLAQQITHDLQADGLIGSASSSYVQSRIEGRLVEFHHAVVIECEEERWAALEGKLTELTVSLAALNANHKGFSGKLDGIRDGLADEIAQNAATIIGRMDSIHAVQSYLAGTATELRKAVVAIDNHLHEKFGEGAL